MLGRIIKLAVVAGAGYAAWKAYADRGAGGDFFAQALREGALEVESARSAQLRGASTGVRRLAQHMEHAHGTINKRLSEEAGTEVPVPDDAQRAALHAIEAHQGDAYDQAWLRHEADAHARAIRLYERAAKGKGPGADVASELLPELRAHAEEITALREGATAQAGNGSGEGATDDRQARPGDTPGTTGAEA